LLAARLSGTVRVTVSRSSGFTVLAGKRLIQVGSTIDTSNGKVKLTAAINPRGATQTGRFWGGQFRVTQGGRRTAVVLTLVGPTGCGGGARTAHAAARHRRRRLISDTRRPFARDSGSSTGGWITRGQSASGTTTSAKWLTEDRCKDTKFAVDAGEVETSGRGGDGKLTRTVSAGEVNAYRCSFVHARRASGHYCLELDGMGSFFNPYIFISGKKHSYDLCVKAPRRQRSCTRWLFTQPQFVLGAPFNQSFDSVFCEAPRAGDYQISWRINGVTLGPPLPYHSSRSQSFAGPCTGFFGNDDDGGPLVTLPANVKRVNRFVLPAKFALDTILMGLAPTGAPGTEVIRGVLYADQDGKPGALLATTEAQTFTSSQKADTYVLFFPHPPHASCVDRSGSYCLHFRAGAYWIGLVTSGASDVAAIHYDSVPGRGAFNVNTSSAGASNPFGPISVDDKYLDLEGDYTPANGPL
jgi:hypothetical protein